jgi:hypothetical protein
MTRPTYLLLLVIAVLFGVLTPSSQAEMAVVQLAPGETRSIQCAGDRAFISQVSANEFVAYCQGQPPTATPSPTEAPTATPSPTDVPPITTPTATPTATAPPTQTPAPTATPTPIVRSVQIGAFTKTLKDNTPPSTFAEQLAWRAGDCSSESIALTKQLRAANPGTEHLAYFLSLEAQNPAGVAWAPWCNQWSYKSGDWATINAHEEWFLHKRNDDGTYSRIAHGNGMYALDPSSPGLRAWIYARAKAIRDAGIFGYDGFFLDNTPQSWALEYRKAYGTTTGKALYTGTTAPLTNDLYVKHAVEFVAGLRAALGPSVPIWGNFIEGAGNITAMQAYLTTGGMTGMFREEWTTDFCYDTGYCGSRSVTTQTNDLRMAEWAIANGKGLVLNGQGKRTDLQRQQFALANYLLVIPANNTQVSFRYTQADYGYGQWWPYDNYALRCGEPRGPRTQPATGWQAREFEFCTVKVDQVNRRGIIEVRAP